MTDDRTVESLRERIFADPDINVYAVLDGASVQGLVHKLWETEANYVCLMPGNLEPDMMEVSPYLVELQPRGELTGWILREGWGNHWGVFAASPAGLIAMRGHCRPLFRTHDERGTPLLFRFYDPRVLRVFLPSCSGQDRIDTFGPVVCWTVEGDSAATLLQFSLSDGQLRKQETPLPAP